MELNSIAFIPDGNRRYAKVAGISLVESYLKGTQKAWEVMEWLKKYPKITVGTFWALSNENLERTTAELHLLFKIFEKELDKTIKNDFFEKNGIRIKFVGRLYSLPKKIQEKVKELEHATEIFSKKTVNIALHYGGRAEIVDAAKKILTDFKQNKLTLNELNEERFKNYLYFPIEPDLIIRTSGTNRLSGFMPYQSVYSELYFCPKYWPEFSEQDLEQAIDAFNERERRYGK